MTTTTSVADPTGEAAIVGRPNEPATPVQCRTCGALGSTADSSRWPILAGRLVHIRQHASSEPAADAEGYVAPPRTPRRTLCGPARQIGES
jgi:hypothetical protein